MSHATARKDDMIVDGELVPVTRQPAPREVMDASELAVGLSSPARRLQAALGREFAAVEAAREERWSVRRTISFVMITCGAFWLSLYFLIAALVG